ncbi:hypothetical protein IAU59_001425 [Kwoniella sp. CBS 9459]
MTSNPPKCPCCQLQQHPLYCTSCLREGIALHNDILRNLQAQIDAIILKSKLLLNGNQDRQDASRLPGTITLRPAAIPGAGLSRGVNAWRELRADVAEREKRCARLKKDIAERELRISREAEDQKADQASSLARTSIAESSATTRRANLATLKAEPSPSIALQESINRCRTRQAEVSSNIIHARLVLVREAVAVFGVRQRSSKEWEIASLVLPSPEAFRLYPSASVNAALSHTIHLLSLLTTYLSIALPFIPTPPPPLEKRHIGRPIVKANTPFVGTTKWRDRHVLWMSSTASIASKIKSTGSGGAGVNSLESYSRRSGKPDQGSTAMAMAMATSTLFSMTTNMSSSKLFTAQPSISAVIEKSMNKHRQFLTSFALLSFSVAYLAWSQGVTSVGIVDRGVDEPRNKNRDKDKDKDKYEEDSDDDTPIIRPRPPSRSKSRQSLSSTPTQVQAEPSDMISATSILELIAALSVSPGLGKKTHEPGTSHVLQHLGFGLDVAKVVQSVLSAEEGRWGGKEDENGSGEELSEGWDLLDAD